MTKLYKISLILACVFLGTSILLGVYWLNDQKVHKAQERVAVAEAVAINFATTLRGINDNNNFSPEFHRAVNQVFINNGFSGWIREIPAPTQVTKDEGEK